MARPRKPTHLKVVAGTAQPCRINKSEPKPSLGRPEAPAHLSERAKASWDVVATMLDNMSVLTKADGLALERLCECYADLQDLRDQLPQERTYETVGPSGLMIRAHPVVAMIADADRRFCMWLSRFGLTPADRSRVSAELRETESPWDALAM